MTLRVETKRFEDVFVASLFGDIDLLTAEALGHDLFTAALEDGPLFVANLDGVDYVDSNGIRMLFALARELDHSRIQWAIALRPDSPLHALFKVTAFDASASIYASDEEAAAALRRATT